MSKPDSTLLEDAPLESGALAELLHRAVAEGRPLAATFDELLNEEGADDETADDMIRAVREWRDMPSTRRLE